MFQMNPVNSPGRRELQERLVRLLAEHEIEDSEEHGAAWAAQFSQDVGSLYTSDVILYLTDEQVWKMYQRWVVVQPDDHNNGPLRRKAFIDDHLGNLKGSRNYAVKGNVVYLDQRKRDEED